MRSGFILGRCPGGAAGDLISGGASALKRAKFFYTEFSDEEWYDGQVRYCDLVALWNGWGTKSYTNFATMFCLSVQNAETNAPT